MKKYIFLLVFVLITPAFLFGCKKEEELKKNSYSIFVSVDTNSMTAECSEKILFVNSSNTTFNALYFHLYPNAFKEDVKSPPVSPSSSNKAYPNGKSYGQINIKSVHIAGNETNFNIEGDDENILCLPLNSILYPDEMVEIFIEFNLILPNINHRFGYGNNTINFGNFYPIACVYKEGEGFKKDCYTSNGDPFFSEVSDYDVSISYQKDYVLASTGREISSNVKDDIKTSTIEANNVRDFCFVLSDQFKVLTFDEGVKINYYYYSDQDPEKSLNTAKNALNFFEEAFGKYPYSDFSVVESNFVYGGMEYPNLVLISDDLSDHDEYEYVIVHETAHQWWYGVVGNDEFNESFLDESLTEYSAALYYEKYPGRLTYQQIIEQNNKNYTEFLGLMKKIYKDLDTSMTRSLAEYKTEPEYVYTIYTRGVLMFDSARTLMGKDDFLKALKKYYSNCKFKIATREDLLSVFEKHGVDKVLSSWLDGNVRLG